MNNTRTYPVYQNYCSDRRPLSLTYDTLLPLDTTNLHFLIKLKIPFSKLLLHTLDVKANKIKYLSLQRHMLHKVLPERFAPVFGQLIIIVMYGHDFLFSYDPHALYILVVALLWLIGREG